MDTQECKSESPSLLKKQYTCDTACREQTAKEALQYKSKELHAQAEMLYALAQSLPDNLCRDADRAIKSMLSGSSLTLSIKQ